MVTPSQKGYSRTGNSPWNQKLLYDKTEKAGKVCGLAKKLLRYDMIEFYKIVNGVKKLIGDYYLLCLVRQEQKDTLGCRFKKMEEITLFTKFKISLWKSLPLDFVELHSNTRFIK